MFRFVLLLLIPGLLVANPHPGAVIYENLCVECHGPNGEGVEGLADDPLRGNRTLEALASRIERTMPEDEDELCVGEDAQSVADYIFHAFYSEDAQLRNQPVRPELARLTARQFKTSVADLVYSFLTNAIVHPDEKRGIEARYFASRGHNAKKENEGRDTFEQLDSRIRFDFGDQPPPVPEGKEFTSEEFSAVWQGGILPPVSGEYEFVIRTRNGVMLWLNHMGSEEEKVFVDGYVAPDNNVRELSRKIHLLGQRVIPFRLEYFSYKEELSSVEFLWKTPGGRLETIPERALLPIWHHETFVPSTPFPADDRSQGYERGTAVSEVWFDAVTAAALETADHIVKRIDKLARTNADDKEREKKTRDFIVNFAERAFRTQFTNQERSQFAQRYLTDPQKRDEEMRKAIVYILTSPQFLYPQISEQDASPSWKAAIRLSLALWDSVPDHRLRQHAEKNQLEKRQHVEREAERMLWEPRARSKFSGFYESWLDLEHGEHRTLDAEKFPEFSEDVLGDLRTSMQLTLDDITWGEWPSYQHYLYSQDIWVNERLAKIYGLDVKGEQFQKVTLEQQGRRGVLTHPYMMTSLAYHDNTSPIHRGVFLTRRIVGQVMKPPPEAIEFEDAHFDPTLTMREKVTEITKAENCMACHSTINPLGFSLENYDALGRYRTMDGQKGIDSTGHFPNEQGEDVWIGGIWDLTDHLMKSPQAHMAFLNQLGNFTMKQPLSSLGNDMGEEVRQRFVELEFNVPITWTHIATEWAISSAEIEQLAKTSVSPHTP